MYGVISDDRYISI